MSKISDLIKKMCPNGVEYKKLEECCNILDNKRKPISKGAREFGEYPYFGANGIQDYISDYIFDGKYVLVGEDGSVQTSSGTPIVNWAEGKIWVNNHAHIIEEIEGISLRYLYHYLQTVNVSDLIHGNIPKLNQGDFRNIKIAIPPKEIQDKIVIILDKFGELEVELEAELEVRRQQYEFWRGKLLNSSTKTYKLDDIAKFTYGFTDKAMDDGDARYIRITDISEDGYLLKNDSKYLNITNENEKYLLNKGDIIVARTGASFGKTLYFNDDYPGIYASFLIKIDLDNSVILNRYYWHFSKSSLYWNQANNLVSRAGQPQFNSNALKKIEINLPSLEEQQKIVNILDKFELLINDISAGIPSEIELRKKQYEYYRNKLLSFEEMS